MSVSVDEYFLGPALVGKWKSEVAGFFGSNPGHRYDAATVVKTALKIDWTNASEIVGHLRDSWAIHTALNQLIADGTIRLEQKGGGSAVRFYLPKGESEKLTSTQTR